MSDEVAGRLVNVDRAKKVGHGILNFMCGKAAKTRTLKKMMTARTLRIKGVITGESEVIYDGQLTASFSAHDGNSRNNFF